MKKTTFPATGILFAGLAAVLISCQIQEPGEVSTQRTHQLPQASETVPVEASIPAVETEPEISGITGLIFAESDVSGIGDSPLADQMIAAVRVEDAGEVLSVDPGSLTEQELRFLNTRLPEPDPAVTITLSSSSGEYTLELNPGAYVLCVLDSESTPPDYPAVTRGCGLTSVEAGTLRRVDISSGFREILLVESP